MTADGVAFDYVTAAYDKIPAVTVHEYEHLDADDPEGDLHVALFLEDHRKETIEQVIAGCVERTAWLFENRDVDVVGIVLQARTADIRVAFGVGRDWFETVADGTGTTDELLDAVEQTIETEGDDLGEIGVGITNGGDQTCQILSYQD